MKFLLLFSLAAICAVGMSAELPIIDDGHSAYQIVLPTDANRHLKAAAQMLSNTLAEMTDVKLPVVSENIMDSAKPGIHLGNTEFARRSGIDTSVLKNWETWMKAAGPNLILAGLDKTPQAGLPDRYEQCLLGSVKAVTNFLEEYAGVRFLMPGPNGIYVPRQKTLNIPGDLNRRTEARVEFCRPRSLEMFYAIANNYFPSFGVKLHGGHSYYYAVSKDKYGQEHPEYFVQKGGSRAVFANHLCISNPDVQELIYRHLLATLDSGYEMMELGQTDDYQQCECDKCARLFGIEDKAEQLWILHRKMAERLSNERPDKKVLIIAYNPTWNPPKTFNEFPANTMIELCNYTPDNLKAWSKVKVPLGFSTYLYNWGSYLPLGISPRRTPRYIYDQSRQFTEHNVKAYYLCGVNGDLSGLEAPVYYAFGKLAGNPALKIENLMADFYRQAYGEAEIPMRNFFDMLHAQLEQFYLNIPTSAKRTPPNPRAMYTFIYTPELLSNLNRQLEQAEKRAVEPKVKKRLELVRAEFSYIRVTATALHYYNTYRLAPNTVNFDQLAAAIETRAAMIDGFYGSGGKIKSFPGWPVRFMGAYTRDVVTQNGPRKISAPFNWNLKLMREKNILPGQSTKQLKVKQAAADIPASGDFESAVWKDAPWHDLAEIQLGKASVPTRFKILRDRSHLYIALEGAHDGGRLYRALGKDGAAWQQDCYEVLLDPFGNRDKYFHFIFNPVENSCYDANFGFATDPLDPNVGQEDRSWNGAWEYRSFLSPGKWSALFKIPFTTLNTEPPQPGTVWTGNVCREYYIQDRKRPEIQAWAPNLETFSLLDRETFGEIIFE